MFNSHHYLKHCMMLVAGCAPTPSSHDRNLNWILIFFLHFAVSKASLKPPFFPTKYKVKCFCK